MFEHTTFVFCEMINTSIPLFTTFNFVRNWMTIARTMLQRRKHQRSKDKSIVLVLCPLSIITIDNWWFWERRINLQKLFCCSMAVAFIAIDWPLRYISRSRSMATEMCWILLNPISWAQRSTWSPTLIYRAETSIHWPFWTVWALIGYWPTQLFTCPQVPMRYTCK